MTPPKAEKETELNETRWVRAKRRIKEGEKLPLTVTPENGMSPSSSNIVVDFYGKVLQNVTMNDNISVVVFKTILKII